ncbi:MAG: glycerol-3-phosphate acyltransferase [Clostridia bacterium]|nr:glycerol-3-phosphate acyltransferase [Clostridia bacterium]
MIGDWNGYAIIAVALVGYFLGNVQTALIVSRLRFRDDVRLYGSGNAGTTNMIRVYGKYYGLITFIGDAGKCVAAFFIGRLIAKLMGLNAADETVSILLGGYISTAAVVLGHCYPVLYQFRGGKGAASAFAMMWCISWQTALISTVLAVVIFLLWKRVSLVSILTSIIYLISTYIAWLTGFVDVYQLFFVLPVVALLLFRHKDNIKRLLRGEEKAITPKDNH